LGPEQKRTRPLILAIDLPSDDVQVIKDAGFNILAGTFGKPVNVERKWIPSLRIRDFMQPAPRAAAGSAWFELPFPGLRVT
jgi:hypothetical protein